MLALPNTCMYMYSTVAGVWVVSVDALSAVSSEAIICRHIVHMYMYAWPFIAVIISPRWFGVSVSDRICTAILEPHRYDNLRLHPPGGMSVQDGVLS